MKIIIYFFILSFILNPFVVTAKDFSSCLESDILKIKENAYKAGGIILDEFKKLENEYEQCKKLPDKNKRWQYALNRIDNPISKINIMIYMNSNYGDPSLTVESFKNQHPEAFIEIVKNSYFSAFTDDMGFPFIGEAFENYFDKPNWQFGVVNGYNVVSFRGLAKNARGAIVSCEILFPITKLEDGMIYHFKDKTYHYIYNPSIPFFINGAQASDLANLLGDIYKVYQDDKAS